MTGVAKLFNQEHRLMAQPEPQNKRETKNHSFLIPCTSILVWARHWITARMKRWTQNFNKKRVFCRDQTSEEKINNHRCCKGSFMVESLVTAGICCCSMTVITPRVAELQYQSPRDVCNTTWTMTGYINVKKRDYPVTHLTLHYHNVRLWFYVRDRA